MYGKLQPFYLDSSKSLHDYSKATNLTLNVDKEGMLIGNFTTPGQKKIEETHIVKTDETGHATITFKSGSVVSRFWYAGLVGDNRSDYSQIAITTGIVKRIMMLR